MKKIRNTKENVIKLLKVKSDSAYGRAKFAKEDGQMDIYDEEMTLTCEIDNVINLLTNQDFFEKTWNIYMNREGKNND